METRIEVLRGSEERPALVHWNSRVAGGTRDCYGVSTPEGLVLIDPEEAAPDAAERLWGLLGRKGAAPVATVLTYTLHERAAPRIRERFGTPIWVPRGRAD